MKFYCYFGKANKLIEVYASQVTKNDIKGVKDWIKFDNANNMHFKYRSERTNFMVWDIAINNLQYLDNKMFKITSNIKGRERLEGLLHVTLNDKREVEIEALEVAPWNREIYLGNNRQFRQLGLILMAYAIHYGFLNGFNGIIRLYSLEIREQYYRDGIKMHCEGDGCFSFSTKGCLSFLLELKRLGLIDVEGGILNETGKKKDS